MVDVKSKEPLTLKYVSLETCENGCCCQGLSLVLESNVGVEYCIGATLGENNTITDQESEVYY